MVKGAALILEGPGFEPQRLYGILPGVTAQPCTVGGLAGRIIRDPVLASRNTLHPLDPEGVATRWELGACYGYALAARAGSLA